MFSSDQPASTWHYLTLSYLHGIFFLCQVTLALSLAFPSFTVDESLLFTQLRFPPHHYKLNSDMLHLHYDSSLHTDCAVENFEKQIKNVEYYNRRSGLIARWDRNLRFPV